MMATPLKVLLVDDSPSDRILTRTCLEDSKLLIELTEVEDGAAALERLRADGPLPDLMLLDLNMPGVDGRDVLAEMRKDAVLRKVPVVVLTSSTAESDVVRSYDLGANCYVTKPVALEQFQEIVNEIAEFWFMVVKLPNGMR